MKFNRPAVALGGALLLLCSLASAALAEDNPQAGSITRPANQIISSNAGPSVFSGLNVNALIGADTFYANGYWGGGAVIANVEAGHIWSGHETLAHVTEFIQSPELVEPDLQFDWHATMVGHVLGGRGWGYGLMVDDFDLATWYGIAPGADLRSARLASRWVGDPADQYVGSFEVDTAAMLYAYRTALAPGAGRRGANVINSSWGGDDSAGRSAETVIVDALAAASGAVIVCSAGNGGAGSAVVGPASGYNTIAVGATASDTSIPPYGQVAAFSSTGPNDFYDPKADTTATAARAVVDIVAPGDNMTLAFYGGMTGGHIAGSDPTAGGTQYYIPDMGGTSFASPVVAGGAALIVDAGYALFNTDAAVDARVVKAVLLNSADKLAGWSNGQVLDGGVIRTGQSLDLASGAGQINLDRAFSQYTAGTTDLPGQSGGGLVHQSGWDFSSVDALAPSDYTLIESLRAGDIFTATLDWFADRRLAADDQPLDVQLADLDLQLWRLDEGTPAWLIAESASGYNNVEHLHFALPDDGQYMLRVLYYGDAYDLPGDTADWSAYGLAWSVQPVPEPASLLLLAAGGATLIGLARRRRAA